jgi:hypothetical protein
VTVAATLAVTRAVAILNGLGVKTPSSASIGLLVAWQACEGGPASRHNPMNTTLRMPGSRAINPEGVQQYPTEAEGITATVQTLRNGLYPQLVRALQTGNTTLFFGATAEMARWGTSMTCIRQAYGGPVTGTPAPATTPRTWVIAVAVGVPLLAILASR